MVYHDDPKFWDRLVWANREDPDQSVPEDLHRLPLIMFASFGHIPMLIPQCSNFRIIMTIFMFQGFSDI